jgi:exodeoxyribonuclease X
MNALIFDTETHDVVDPQIIQAAGTFIEIAGSQVIAMSGFMDSYKPSKPITHGAMAVHNIMDEDLENERPSSEFKLPDGVEYLIGHNVDFDWEAAGKPDVKRICTLAMARSIWPTASAHTLGALLYMLERENAREILTGAHAADVDVEICTYILNHILMAKPEIQNMEQLYEFSEFARIPTIMAFGKHKGMAVKDLPGDYKSWILRQADIDPYLKKAIRGN